MIAKLIGTKTFWTSLAGAVVGLVTLVGVVAAHGDLKDPRVAAAATAGASLAALIGNIGSIFAAHDSKKDSFDRPRDTMTGSGPSWLTNSPVGASGPYDSSYASNPSTQLTAQTARVGGGETGPPAGSSEPITHVVLKAIGAVAVSVACAAAYVVLPALLIWKAGRDTNKPHEGSVETPPTG